jgi:AraC-like DNA-binding protein
LRLGTTETPLQRIAFSSDQLPADLGDRARLSAWHESLAPVNSFDVSYLPDTPFFARTQFIQSGATRIIQLHGAIARLWRTSRHVARDRDDGLSVLINSGRVTWSLSQRGREGIISPGLAILTDNANASDYRASADGAELAVSVPREELLALVANAEDLVGLPLDPDAAPVRHLRRYLELALGPDGFGADAALNDHLARTVLDLVALALGAGRDAAELARLRGLRAARLREVLHEIKSGFADPGCSPQRVALKLGLSARYIHDLLQETAATFTERVIELRLQKARAMLESTKGDGLKVGDIAALCGFNDLSYFNRLFRRRFGASPTQFRGRSEEPGR